MKKRTFSLLFVVALLLFRGCFNDDLSDCPVRLQVYFESVMTKYRYEEVAKQLDLYLYDGMNMLAGHFTYTREELEAVNHRPEIPLGGCDHYTLLALLNAGDTYVVTAPEQLSDFSVSLPALSGDTVKSKQPDLFFGRKEIRTTEIKESNRCIYEVLPLYKNTNHLFVNVTFEAATSSQKEDPDAFVEGNNGAFDQQNRCHPSSRRVYLPHDTFKGVESVDIQFRFTTMQLYIGSDLLLLLKEKDKECFRLQIMDYLSKIYETDEELDQEDMFYFNLVLKDDFTIVELMINGWYVIRSGVEV